MIHGILALVKFEMNFTNFEILSVIFYFSIVDVPNQYSQYVGPAGPRKKSFLSKFQPQRELRLHKVKDQGGEEGDHVGDPGGL